MRIALRNIESRESNPVECFYAEFVVEKFKKGGGET